MSTGYVIAPIDAADQGFREITPHVGSNEGASLSLPVLHAVGTFDPARLPGFSALTRVPLGTYAPPQAAPADPRSRTLLAGRDLLPNSNFAGYLTPPPTLLTTLASVPIFEGSAFGGPKPAGPISVIRVRVAGVTGADAVSRERVRAAAQQIAKRTGLAVDVTLGSSPTPQRVELAAGKYGRPGLSLLEGWVKKGVAVAIFTAVDRKSLVLFVLILLVCALVVSNAASAAVRARRTELGMLACLGWSTRRLFTLMLGEVAVVGLVAGAAGSAVALPLAGILGLASSPARAVLAIPAAVLLSLLAGLTPAWRAARSHPAAAVRPAVLSARRARDPRTMLGLAATNLLRVPGRSLLGALSLAVGVCALTLLLTVTISFRGVLVGSLLGEAVSVQIRGVDYLAVATIIALGGFAVADVLYLNVRERAVELATLQAMGWTDATLARLLTFEGAGMGLAGGLAGSVLGLSGAAIFGGALPSSLWLIAVLGTGAGTIIAVLSAVVPAQLLRRLPISQLLAEE